MGQTSVSTLSERGNYSVDGLDKGSFANCDAPNSGNQTPPLKRKGRLSSIGKIFKPWKWRKKKASEKFRETSAVLERKISMRQSREELIRRGVLKEIPDQDGDVPVNVETSNGHTVPINEEPTKEEKTAAENGSITLKSPVLEEKAEDTKAAGSHKKNDAAAKDTAVGAGKQLPSVLPKPTYRTASHSTENKEKTMGTSEPKPKNSSKNVTAGPSLKKDDTPNKKTVKGVTKQLSAPPSKTSSRVGTQENAAPTYSRKTVATKSSSLTPSSSSRSKPKEQVSSKIGSSLQRAKKVPNKATSGPAEGVPQPTSSNTHSLGKKKTERTDHSSPHSINQDVGQKQQTVSDAKLNAMSTSPALNHKDNILKNMENSNQDAGTPSQPIICNINVLPLSDVEDKTSPQALNNECEENVNSVVLLEEQEDNSSLISQETTEELSDTATNPDGESGKESQTSDSDSDGPILYTDDEDDDSSQSALASKVRRRDTLAIKLGNRPSKKDLEDKNILPRNSEEERQEMWQQIGTKLVRRLSQRPTTEELEQRNILKQKNEEEELEERRELKRRLTRKLSLRPSVAELQARRILRFNEYVEVTDSLEYDRRADKPWARLTPADKAAIRKELNEFKSTEMEVHEESRQFTRFHRP
ncbi:hypothetical protein GDO86_009476 [Hymenochirus boettgeri]|uniref:Phosphatase and actin regulator n=1 Tax=Hymenochirus boettgeri TaxID=247094 RepID=A0A8T2JG69_9PIPI|nr:hypothetical protein GDO86_009476 [Hymenochirus boettgeri]